MTKPGSDVFQIEYLDAVVAEDISVITKIIRNRIKRAIGTRLTMDPVGLGKPLRYSFKGHNFISKSIFKI